MLTSLLKALRAGKAGSLRPKDAATGTSVQPHRGLALALEKYECGEIEVSEVLAREYLAVHPDQPTALSILAAIAADRGQFPQACEIYERIIGLTRADPEWLCMGAEMNRRSGRITRALELCRESIALDPRNVKAWLVEANTLQASGRLSDARQALKRAMSLDPTNAGLHSRMLFLLVEDALLSPEETLAEHRVWAARHADHLKGAVRARGNPPDPDRRLNIGYISGDFRRHVVSHFIEPVLIAHNRSQFEISCYSNCLRPDDRTQQLRGLADIWRDIARLGDDAVAERIRGDAIDILVDLSGHTLGNRLLVLARKPAPVQVTWLGYLGTTGMTAVDYCISDQVADPAGLSETHYVEKLLRLPVSQWCYRPPEGMPSVSPPPALDRGHITFGSFAGFPRLNAELFQVWATILRTVPGARLRLIGLPAGESLDAMLEIFESAGVSADRLDLVGWLSYEEYLSQFREVDIALGTYPYNGATTICETLWMGLPIVSRVGHSRPARAAASLLSALGMTDLLATSWDEYIGIASRLASDLPQLATLRAEMRDRVRRSPLVDARSFTAGLEEAYRGIWRNWCASRGGGNT